VKLTLQDFYEQANPMAAGMFLKERLIKRVADGSRDDDYFFLMMRLAFRANS